MRYTFDMGTIEDIYEAVDDYGLITSAEARGLGVSNKELVQYARRGKLAHAAHGVYRMPVWPYQEAAPYALAVKSCGEGAFLWGESVVALLGLAPTDPRRIWVASPGRVRRNLGDGVRIVERQQDAETTMYDGVPCQAAAQAIRTSANTMGRERALQAAREAEREGYVTRAELAELMSDLGGKR